MQTKHRTIIWGLSISIAVVFAIIAFTPIAHVETAAASMSTYYYPNISPSSWYILPGQTLGFSGSGFAPNETVHIQGPSTDFSAKADSGGNFAAVHVIKIPYSWEDSTQTFTINASISDSNVTPSPLTITIGTFYPQITPSDWWVAYGQNISVSGTSFAPRELVRLFVNGAQVAEHRADAAGNVTFTTAAPSSGDTATLTATGASSGLSSTRTIFLHS